jgi:hypothetical protein
MRWLIIALLVSMGGLLLAAVGVVRHIRLHRIRLRQASSVRDAAVVGLDRTSDVESER